jgi:hypothetical protein
LPLRISAPLLFYHVAMSRIAATFTESSAHVRLEIIAENRFAEPHSQRDFAQ